MRKSSTEQPCEDPDHPEEVQANAFTRDGLIPPKFWKNFGKSLVETRDESVIKDAAERLSVSPAIIAGRVRWEMRDYTRFTDLVGNKKVRFQFPEYDCVRG